MFKDFLKEVIANSVYCAATFATLYFVCDYVSSKDKYAYEHARNEILSQKNDELMKEILKTKNVEEKENTEESK